MTFKTIEWKGTRVRILDQRKLPQKVQYIDCLNANDVAQAVRGMAIRGAPAIGVAAAMGVALTAKRTQSIRPEIFHQNMKKVCQQMIQTRPTAVNLFWAVDRMMKVLDEVYTIGVGEVRNRLEQEAIRICEEDVESNRKIGENGKVLIQDGDGILTHCNAGALATAGYGTALGVIRAAWAEGKRFQVFVDETRPLLQGARLTAWELSQEKIPFTLLTDNMAGWVMKKGEVNLVLVGADRIARNGDTANKIGTYILAVLSKWHKIPFYVAAPTSTVDLKIASGLEMPIEERDHREVTSFQGITIAPRKTKVFNPAFDVTPQSLVKAIITEKGILRKPFGRSLRRITS